MRSTLFGICIAIFLLSCTKEKSTDGDHFNTYSVVLGHVCGWCAGADSLYVTVEELTYTEIDYCNDSLSIQKKPFGFNDLNPLMDLIEIEDFLNISINTCYVCVDGCDTWVTISNDTLSHTIRFGYRDSLEVSKVQAFIDALHVLQSGFLTND